MFYESHFNKLDFKRRSFKLQIKACSTIFAQQSRFPHLVFLLEMYRWPLSPCFQHFTLSVFFCVNSRTNKDGSINSLACPEGKHIYMLCTANLQIASCQSSSLVKLVFCGTSASLPSPLPQHHHHHHWMHMLITLSYLFFCLFRSHSLSLYLSLSGNLDRWALWWLAIPIHNQLISSAYLLIIVFLCSGLLCPGVGWMTPWSWVLILLCTDKGRGWGLQRMVEKRVMVEVWGHSK